MHENSARCRGRTLSASAAAVAATALLATACGSPTFTAAPSKVSTINEQAPAALPSVPKPSAGPGWAVELDINNMTAVDSSSDPQMFVPLCTSLGADARQAVGRPLSGAAVAEDQWNTIMKDLEVQASNCLAAVRNGDQPSLDEAIQQTINDGNTLVG